MKEYRFFKILLWKRFFDTGLSITGYLKYILLIAGIGGVVDSIGNLKLVFIIGFIYAIVCFVIGWAFFKYGLFETDQEITNMFNPFVKEVRNGELLFGSPKNIKRRN